MKGVRLLLAAIGGFVALSTTTPSFAFADTDSCLSPGGGDCWATLGPGGCISIPWGWYIDFSVGITRLEGANHNSNINSGVNTGNINLGYKFMPYFGIELGYIQLADITIKTPSGVNVATSKNRSLDLAVKAILPLGSFEAFAKIGIGVLQTHNVSNNSSVVSPVPFGTRNRTGMFVGLGVQYYFTPNLAAQILWLRPNSSNNNNNGNGIFNLYLAGVSFIYG